MRLKTFDQRERERETEREGEGVCGRSSLQCVGVFEGSYYNVSLIERGGGRETYKRKRGRGTRHTRVG